MSLEEKMEEYLTKGTYAAAPFETLDLETLLESKIKDEDGFTANALKSLLHFLTHDERFFDNNFRVAYYSADSINDRYCAAGLHKTDLFSYKKTLEAFYEFSGYRSHLRVVARRYRNNKWKKLELYTPIPISSIFITEIGQA